MTQDLSIRRFESKDAESLLALWNEALPSSQPWNDHWFALCRKVIVDDLVFVAKHGDRPVGAVIAGYDGVRGWIYSLAVLPGHRHQGIGRKLVKTVEAALVQFGCQKINLQVRADNREVVDFYRHCGYSTEDRVSMGKPLVGKHVTVELPTLVSFR